MTEKVPTPEAAPKPFPSHEELVNKFEAILAGQEHTKVRRLEDNKGVYLWEVRLSEPGKDGFYTEYSYTRAGSYPEGSSDKSRIDVVFYDSDGVPVGGHDVVTYTENGWSD